MKALDIESSRLGELLQQECINERGKHPNIVITESFDAIFTFNEVLVCSENNIPINGGYFMIGNGQVEVTQLIGRFPTSNERTKWVENTFKLIKQNET